MKVFKDIGSKERLFEVFNNVNKTKLNEDFGNQLDSKQTLELSFADLLNDRLKVNEVNTQADDNEVSVELVCFDNAQNNIIFRFTGIANESATDGVFTFNDAKMIGFSFDAADDSGSVELDESGLQEFNMQHQKEILDVVTNHADVESGVETPAFGLEEAIKIIDAIKMDSMPYGGEFEKMQTAKNYVDKKPVNDKIRVNAEELDKFIKEADDFLKMFPDDMEKVDKQIMLNKRLEGSAEFFDTLPPQTRQELLNTGVARLVQQMQQHPQTILNQVGYDEFKNLAWKQIEPFVEELRLQQLNEKWKDDVEIKKTGEHADKTIDQLQRELDALKGKEPYDREKAGELSFAIRAKRDWKGGVDEETVEEGDYPEKMGKEFSPQTSYPKKRKKHPQKVKIKTTAKKPTTISEYEEEDDEIEIAGLPEIPSGRGAKMQAVKDIKQDVGNELAPEIGSEPTPDDLPTGTKIDQPHDWRPEIGRHMDIKEPYPYTSPLREEEAPYGGKLDQIQQELSQIQSRLDTGRTPKMWVGDDGLLHLSAEDGEYFADYYNEFGGGYPTIDSRVEAVAEKYGLYWDWDDAGSIVLVDDSMAEGKESVEVEEPKEKELGGEIKMSPEDNDRMLSLAGIEKGEEEEEEPVGDQIAGGLADEEDAQGYDPQQVLKGMEVEMEHTDDPKIALEIALDHLKEIPDYYTRLDKMEKEAGVGDGEEEPEDKETEDELLGFKPHNVGDYADGGEEEEMDETGSSWNRV